MILNELATEIIMAIIICIIIIITTVFSFACWINMTRPILQKYNFPINNAFEILFYLFGPPSKYYVYYQF